MTRIALLLITTLLLCTSSAPASAETATRKFGRGLAGMTTSWLEVPGNMVAESQKSGLPTGIPLGFAKGLGMIVPRTLVGVYEFVTAPFPAPEGYRPLLQPEFPWSYFDQGSKVATATKKKPAPAAASEKKPAPPAVSSR